MSRSIAALLLIGIVTLVIGSIVIDSMIFGPMYR